MRVNRVFASLVVLSLALVAGCGGGGGNLTVTPPPSGGTASVSLVLTDTPPAGVTVLSFKVTLTGAVLNPGATLVNSPVTAELKRLEVENAFLGTFSVPPNTYSSITLTFANPDLTFKNDTGATLAGCASGLVCEISPTGTLAVTASIPAPGLSASPNNLAALLVDVNLNNVINGTLGVNFAAPGGVTVSQLSATPPAAIERVLGQVTAKDPGNNQFTLQTTLGTLQVNVDTTSVSRTVFQDFLDAGCSSANFACVQVNQIVAADLNLLSDGTLLATTVALKDSNNFVSEVEGVIFAVDSPSQFRMVVRDVVPSVLGIDSGRVVTVFVSFSSFGIDDEGQNTSGFSFNGPGDLLVGQEVLVRPFSNSPGTTMSADRVRLAASRLTATVAGTPGASRFNISNLPSLFTTAGITQIQVQTSTSTEFQGVTGIGALAAGNTVSLRGQLFKAGAQLVASKVLKR